MFFRYPAQAIQENWVHRALVLMVGTIHLGAVSNDVVPPWPEIIPPRARARLRGRPALRRKLGEYRQAFDALTAREQSKVHAALFAQNRISDLLCNATSCRRINELPPGIRQPAIDLFTFGFDLLIDFEVRDEHYRRIHDSVPSHVCPFCGLESLDAPAPELAREDYDHYLPKSVYPYAAANLWNLVPMCHKCNGRYKKAKDLIRAGRMRRPAFHPYGRAELIEIDLTESEPSGGVKPLLPNWIIRFKPPSNEAETWDTVFSVRTRLAKNAFDRSYSTWLNAFARWSERRAVRSVRGVLPALRAYERVLKEEGFEDQAFLKLAVCRMLIHRCATGDGQLLKSLFNSIRQFA